MTKRYEIMYFRRMLRIRVEFWRNTRCKLLDARWRTRRIVTESIWSICLCVCLFVLFCRCQCEQVQPEVVYITTQQHPLIGLINTIGIKISTTADFLQQMLRGTIQVINTYKHQPFTHHRVSTRTSKPVRTHASHVYTELFYWIKNEIEHLI